MIKRSLLVALVVAQLAPVCVGISWKGKEIAPRLVAVSGANRGVGIGIVRQLLKIDPNVHVAILSRKGVNADAAAAALGPRAHPVQCDVTDHLSVRVAARELSGLGGSELFVLINNAGVAIDLPWIPPPWPASAAADTLSVNLYGAERLTRMLMSQLLASKDGRVVFVSSGAGSLNMKRMGASPRTLLASSDVKWDEIDKLAATFTREYETAATEQALVSSLRPGKKNQQMYKYDLAPLPYQSNSGLWLNAYGFSKACINAYSRTLARERPTLISVATTPGWVKTVPTSSYHGDVHMRTMDEGGSTIAWLATGARGAITSGTFYTAEREVGSWVAHRMPTLPSVPYGGRECSDGDLPALIIGGGRIGSLLLELGCDGDVLMGRGEPYPANAPSSGPIYVATFNEALEGVVGAVPKDRHADLVFMQNGMLAPFLAKHGLHKNTQALLYLAVKARGEPAVDGKTELNPQGLTVVSGKWAGALAARLAKGGLGSRERKSYEFKKAMLEKLVWICSFMLVGQLHGGVTIGELLNRHPGELESMTDQLVHAGERELEVVLDPFYFRRMTAYAQTVRHYPTSIKEYEWRNGWFLAISQREIEAGREDPIPKHTLALNKLGMVPAGSAGAATTPWQRWGKAWQQKYGGWWQALNEGQRGDVQACFSALGLHMASRFDRILRMGAKGGTLGGPPPAARADSLPNSECEWVSAPGAVSEKGAAVPEMPEVGEALRMTMPAQKPVLLPGCWDAKTSLIPTFCWNANPQSPNEQIALAPGWNANPQSPNERIALTLGGGHGTSLLGGRGETEEGTGSNLVWASTLKGHSAYGGEEETAAHFSPLATIAAGIGAGLGVGVGLVTLEMSARRHRRRRLRSDGTIDKSTPRMAERAQLRSPVPSKDGEWRARNHRHLARRAASPWAAEGQGGSQSAGTTDGGRMGVGGSFVGGSFDESFRGEILMR